MKALLFSPSFISKSTNQKELIQVLINLKKKLSIACVSNNEKPAWFDDLFNSTNIKFFQVIGRQSGDFIRKLYQKNNVNSYDIGVLTTTFDDLEMAKNGNSIMLTAQWSTDSRVKGYGISIDNSVELEKLITHLLLWTNNWTYNATCYNYSVYSLMNLSGKGNISKEQADFSEKMIPVVKNGGHLLNTILVLLCRSLIMKHLHDNKNLVFGIYPSHNVTNGDSDILSDFCHRVRTTVSRVRFAKKDMPLLLRVKTSIKRSKSYGVDRKDPNNELETLTINPCYKGKLKNKHIILFDDCTTYGLSFGVANFLFQQESVASFTGIALGKIGNQFTFFNINKNGSVYNYTSAAPNSKDTKIDQPTQNSLLGIFDL